MRLAVIPARGGSRRIPRKNVRAFGGRPMLAWAVETATASGLFDRVIVSTDDAEIAAVATAAGAECPFERPAELATDHATTPQVMAHATRWAVEQGLAPASVCCLYSATPFLDVADLAAGCVRLESGGWSYVVSATEFPAPIFRSFRQREDGGLDMFFPEHYTTRSQDLPEALHDAAQFYWGLAEAWLEERPLFDQRTCAVRIPRWRVVDIDTPDDWTRAELLLPQLKGVQP